MHHGPWRRLSTLGFWGPRGFVGAADLHPIIRAGQTLAVESLGNEFLSMAIADDACNTYLKRTRCNRQDRTRTCLALAGDTMVYAYGFHTLYVCGETERLDGGSM